MNRHEHETNREKMNMRRHQHVEKHEPPCMTMENINHHEHENKNHHDHEQHETMHDNEKVNHHENEHKHRHDYDHGKHETMSMDNMKPRP